MSGSVTTPTTGGIFRTMSGSVTTPTTGGTGIFRTMSGSVTTPTTGGKKFPDSLYGGYRANTWVSPYLYKTLHLPFPHNYPTFNLKSPIMKKTLYIISGIFLLLIMASLTQYHADIPLEDLKAEYAPPPSKFITIDSMSVHYRDEGTGFPVVLIHGMSSSLHTWQGWAEMLSKQYRVIRMDLPGFGLTGPNANNDYSVAYYEGFIGHLLDSLGIKECYMAGNSLGGLITWNYALHHSQQVRKIVLLDAAGYPIASPPFVLNLAKNKLLRPVFRYITPRFLVSMSMKQVYGDASKITDSVTERYFKLALRTGNRGAFIAFANGFHDMDTLPIQQITTPTLIEWGDKDKWIPLADAKRFHRDIKGSELVVYPGVAHIPMEEIPAISCADAMRFFAEPVDSPKDDRVLADRH
jgi:pimeloyl-ACP methyl ester carboxylesterase